MDTTRLLSTKDVHERNGSRDGLKGKHGSHGDHGSTSLSHLDLFEAGLFLGGKRVLEVERVEASVTGGLGRLATEVITGVSDTLSLGNRDEGKNGTEPDGLFLGKDTKSLGPVRLLGESGEVEAKSESSLYSCVSNETIVVGK